MPTWTEFEAAAPARASVRARLDAHTHKTLATLRGDGSPRISGTESQIATASCGSARCGRRARRTTCSADPRFALHSGSTSRRSGRATPSSPASSEEITDPARVAEINGDSAPSGPSHLFRLDLHEVSTVGLDDARKALVIEVWTPERGVRTIRRK